MTNKLMERHGRVTKAVCIIVFHQYLDWGSKMSCPRTLPWKHPEDPVQLDVTHFTTEPCETPPNSYKDSSRFNPLSDMPILGSSNSTANKDTISKIWTNGDIVIWLSWKHCGKRRNCSLRTFSPFPTMFSKAACWWCVKMSILGAKGYIQYLNQEEFSITQLLWYWSFVRVFQVWILSIPFVHFCYAFVHLFLCYEICS